MGTGMTIFGVFGNIVSVGLILAPLPTIWKIVQKRSTEKFSPLPYAAIMLSSSLWLFYGSPLVHSGILIETINSFGVGMEAAFLVVFFVFASDRRTRIQVLLLLTSILLFVAMVVSLTLAFVHGKSRRRTVVGVISAFLAVMMYASPLSIMRMVIKTKSTKYMPFLLSLMAFLNAALWGSYAILGHDLYIMVPSVIGAGLGIAQLVLYACYCRRYGDDDIEFDLEHKLAGTENMDSSTDTDFRQAPRKAAGEKINMLITIDPEFRLSPGNVTSHKINGQTSPGAPQSPGTENYAHRANDVDRS